MAQNVIENWNPVRGKKFYSLDQGYKYSLGLDPVYIHRYL